MRIVPVIMTIVGMVLVYCGVTDRSPIAVVRAAVSGEELPESGSLSESVDDTPDVPLDNTPEDGEWHGAPGDSDGDGLPDPPSDIPPGVEQTGNSGYTSDGYPIYRA